jgi:hypothetical protein
MRRSCAAIAVFSLGLFGLAGSPGEAQEGHPRTSADDDALRHVEKGGGFSFIPPESWNPKEFPGLKFKVVVGPVHNGFTASINVVEESFRGSLDEYVKGNIATLQKILKNFEMVKQEEFKTTAGLQGVRLIVKNHQFDKDLRQTFYFFGGTADTKYVVTCTTLADDGEKLGPVFERALKTFRFEKQ